MKLSTATFHDIESLSHRQIEAAMDKARLNEYLRHEVRLMFRSWTLKGYFSYSVDRVEFTYGGYRRKELKRFLENCGLVRLIDDVGRGRCKGYVIGGKCKRYVFRLEGILPSKFSCPTDIDSSVGSVSGREPAHRVQAGYGRKVLIPSTFFRGRCFRWVAACKEFGWRIRADWTGATRWGSAVLRGLASICLPRLGDRKIAEMAGDGVKGKWWARYFRGLQAEASSFVVRIRGRCYHALVNCPREIRKLLTVEDQGRTEPMVTVDMSSTYTAILVGQMWDSPERTRLQELLATKGFYSAINDELSENQRYADYAELKRQFQKQCLFWRDPRLTERPLWQAMRKLFPQLARYIESLRQRLGVTGLSDHLMEAESALFVDNVLVRCDEKQIPCVPIHDALLVPQSAAYAVKQELERQASLALGYVPSFKIAA